jgi:hypothetical protein
MVISGHQQSSSVISGQSVAASGSTFEDQLELLVSHLKLRTLVICIAHLRTRVHAVTVTTCKAPRTLNTQHVLRERPHVLWLKCLERALASSSSVSELLYRSAVPSARTSAARSAARMAERMARHSFLIAPLWLSSPERMSKAPGSRELCRLVYGSWGRAEC